MRVVIDTDPGVDDAIAILLALAAPQMEVVGLTTTGGNVPRARATRNALALLEAAGRIDIPAAQGAARPLRGRFRPSVAFHGPGGMSVRLPNASHTPAPETAVELLNEQLSLPWKVTTVIALGPLTNLARLEMRHPGILARAQRVVIMGGAVETRGNVTQYAEFNFHSDPDAAARVLGLGLPIALADLGACRQVSISRTQAENLSANNPIGSLALRVLQGWFQRDSSRERFEFYDPLAVALTLDPEVAAMRQVALDVVTEPEEQRGQSVVRDGAKPLSLAAEVNAPRFYSLLERLLGWRGL